MKHIYNYIIWFSYMLFCCFSVSAQEKTVDINWMSWEEALAANEKEPRKMFIDVYTEWCGWCKNMDKGTFLEPAFVKEINENFYAIKLDAELHEDLEFRDHKFSLVTIRRRSTHQLAYAMLDGRMSFPSFAYLDENYARIMKTSGFKGVNEIMSELQYVSSEAYLTNTYKEYKKEAKNSALKH